MSFISGAFKAIYNGRYMGAVEDGYEMITSLNYEMIQADHYAGDLDGVVRGMNMMLRAVFLEVDMPALYDLFWPWDGDSDGLLSNDANFADNAAQIGEMIVQYGAVGPSGLLLSQFAKPLVLVPCAGTTAKSKGKLSATTPFSTSLTSITFHKVVVSADPIAIKFNGGHRKVPLSMIVLPYEVPTGGSGAFTPGGGVYNEDDLADIVPGATLLCGPKRYFTVA